MILAGIDIGTNTLRLLVADIQTDSFQAIHEARRTTRLGEDLDRTAVLSDDAQARSVEVLVAFKKSIDRIAPSAAAVSAVGTSALRNAENASHFIRTVSDRTGMSIRVLSGDEEARLTLLGVTRSLPQKVAKGSPLLVVDIGGGSTELTATLQGEVQTAESMPLGAVYLTERYIRHDPPDRDELIQLRRSVVQTLDRSEALAVSGPERVLVGTAGTVTTLAAMDLRLERYDPESIHGHVLTREAIASIVAELARSTLNRRRQLPGLEPGREDIILAGALITQELMDRMGYETMIVSDWGMREGILIDLYGKMVTGGV